MMDILVWRGKHGDQYYAARTPEELEKSALTILQELFDSGWIYEPTTPSEPSEEEAEALELTEEAIESLPSSLREQVMKLRKRVAARQKAHAEEAADYELIKKLLAGEEVWYVARRKARYDEETWASICEAARTKWKGIYDVQGEVIRGRASAWGVLQQRNGGEYEDFNLESVMVP